MIQTTCVRQRTTLRGEVYQGTDFVTLIRCEHCGSEFKPRNCEQIYCSKSCRAAGKRQPPIESRRCDFCGDEFVPTNRRQTTCSGRCRTAKCRQPSRVQRQLDEPRREAWNVEKNRYKSLEFDGRFAGPDNEFAGPLKTYRENLKPTASDVVAGVLAEVIAG